MIYDVSRVKLAAQVYKAVALVTRLTQCSYLFSAIAATPPLVSWYQELNVMTEFAARIASSHRREPNAGGEETTNVSFPNIAGGILKQ